MDPDDSVCTLNCHTWRLDETAALADRPCRTRDTSSTACAPRAFRECVWRFLKRLAKMGRFWVQPKAKCDWARASSAWRRKQCSARSARLMPAVPNFQLQTLPRAWRTRRRKRRVERCPKAASGNASSVAMVSFGFGFCWRVVFEHGLDEIARDETDDQRDGKPPPFPQIQGSRPADKNNQRKSGDRVVSVLLRFHCALVKTSPPRDAWERLRRASSPLILRAVESGARDAISKNFS
jgi:hypothetical protein